jgi:hypothetical protein
VRHCTWTDDGIGRPDRDVRCGLYGHIDNRDPIALLGRERSRQMVWQASERNGGYSLHRMQAPERRRDEVVRRCSRRSLA